MCCNFINFNIFPELKQFIDISSRDNTINIMQYIGDTSVDNDKTMLINNIRSIECSLFEDVLKPIQNFNKSKGNINQKKQEGEIEIDNICNTLNNLKQEINQLKQEGEIAINNIYTKLENLVSIINNGNEERSIFPELNLSSFNNFNTIYLKQNELLFNKFTKNMLKICNLHEILMNRHYKPVNKNEADDLLFQNKYRDYLLVQNVDEHNSLYNIEDTLKRYRYIPYFNIDGKLEIYELVGMKLSSWNHAVAFVKNNNAYNSSWNAIDNSSGPFNDDNCNLNDILYDTKKNNNTHVAKECENMKYKPIILLYKRVLFESLLKEIQEQITNYKKYDKHNKDMV